MMYKIIRFAFLFLIVNIYSSCHSSKTSQTASKQKNGLKSKLSEAKKLEFERCFYNANKEKMLANYLEAANLFRKCLQINPGSSAAMYELANLLFVKGDYATAEYLSLSASLIEPYNEWYLDLYANSLTRNNKINDAIKVRKKMVQLFPDHVEYLFNLAESFVYASKFEDAIEVFDKIEKITGISEQVTQQKKLLYIQLNKLDKAIAEVQKLIDSNPSEPSYYEILAELYSANKMQDKALEVYQKIISIDPQNANIHLYLSHYYGQTGKAEMAYNEMKLAFENSNLELDYKIKEMLRYYTSMELNDTIKMQGIELLEIMQRAHPKEANALSVYADFLMKDNRIKEARDKYYKALELEKDRLPIWNQLLIIDSQLNDYSAMEKDSKQAIELFPNETNTYFFNGIANLQLGNSKQAIQVLKQGLDLIVENPQLSGQFYANLGDAYYRDKQMELSDSAYEMALKLNPEDTYVLNNYSYYLSLRKEKLERAELMSKKANELEPNNGNSQDTYAWILYVSEKYEEAKIWIEKAVKNGGEKNPVILEHYGDILFKLGEKDKALDFWLKSKDSGKGSEFLERKINEKKLFE